MDINRSPLEEAIVKDPQGKYYLLENSILPFADSCFKKVFKETSLNIMEVHKPLATGQEPFRWYQELPVPFWDVYVLNKS